MASSSVAVTLQCSIIPASLSDTTPAEEGHPTLPLACGRRAIPVHGASISSKPILGGMSPPKENEARVVTKLGTLRREELSSPSCIRLRDPSLP